MLVVASSCLYYQTFSEFRLIKTIDQIAAGTYALFWPKIIWDVWTERLHFLIVLPSLQVFLIILGVFNIVSEAQSGVISNSAIWTA
jgi:hypothetical protein